MTQLVQKKIKQVVSLFDTMIYEDDGHYELICGVPPN